ncbi:MAG TPA: deoxyribodipyrimidine photo-lyase [Candidatus Baltobacteraceae bacterium]|nr:deoxyribodipyrimidine photo-lyase [Candidatus Baltobacteraceae bacterium]
MDQPRYARSIVWLRRDLRLSDNVALASAAERSREVIVAFNLDPELLSNGRVGAPLVQAFFEALGALRESLRKRGSDLALLEGRFDEQLLGLVRQTGASAVFFNEDYEPAAIARDARVTAALRNAGIDVHAFLDHVCFGADEVRTDAQQPYRVFTPYKRRWRDRYLIGPRRPVASEVAIDGKLLARALLPHTREEPTPESFGFTSSQAYPACGESYARMTLEAFLEPGGPAERYADARDVPAIDGTSHLSVQLRAGTVGIRTCFEAAFAAERASPHASQIEKWTDELIWREFYQMILHEFPYVAEGPFVRAAARIVWNDDDAWFARWCEGTTGYPIVDAGMRQLNQRGWMHNRLRMIVASFLTKDLRIDWRRGERYFETHLADADLAQNNGGWQWAASTGTDAAPYFRIFNPVTQGKRFDPGGAFIRAMIPELRNVAAPLIHEPWKAGVLAPSDYPAPVVEHGAARLAALAMYQPVMGRASS